MEGSAFDARLARDLDALNERLAATRARLAAQDARLARVRDDIARLRVGYAAIQPPPPPGRSGRFAPALAFLAVTLFAGALKESRAFRGEREVARLRDAVASERAVSAPATMSVPGGDNVVAEGIRLVYAYRPTAAPVTVGEILEPMLGKELRPTSFELDPIAGASFWIVFKPFTDDVGLAHQYRFKVDAARREVQPTPETAQLLRLDAAGAMASRSDLEGFRKALDLSSQDEVLVGEPAGRVRR